MSCANNVQFKIQLVNEPQDNISVDAPLVYNLGTSPWIDDGNYLREKTNGPGRYHHPEDDNVDDGDNYTSHSLSLVL
jgi:hypothetical protein